MTYIVLFFLFVFLAGVFDACMDIRKDCPQQSVFAKVEVQWFRDWFAGGNDHYTLPIWGPCDFWHLSKSCLMGCWTLAALMAFHVGWDLNGMFWLPLVGALFAYWLEGFTFFLFYHHILKRSE